MKPKVDTLGRYITENIRVTCPLGYFGDDTAVEKYVCDMYNKRYEVSGLTVTATVMDSDEDRDEDEYVVRVELV